jgi:hypothetical protein
LTKLVAAGAALVGVVLPGIAQSQSISCSCRHQGLDYSLGETICLKGPNGPRMATCSMVLNNTSWKFTEAPCPFALNITPRKKADTPTAKGTRIN